METRDVRVLVETAQHRIRGTLQLPRDGYRSRVTDFLNATERDFIALTEVELEAIGRPEGVVRRDFLALSRRHIVLAVEEDAPEP